MQTDLFPEGSAKLALSDVLKQADIEHYVGGTALHRGRSYQRNGRVFDLVVSADLTSIQASVDGSRDEPYQVTIVLSRPPGSHLKIDGKCTCPMGQNCKHVAAVLFEALSRSRPAQSKAVAPAAPKPIAPAPVVVPLPYEVKSWLDEFVEIAGGDSYPLDVNQRVVYMIHAQASPNHSPHLAIEPLVTRLLKSGGYSGNTSRPAIYNYYAGNYPRYFRSADIEICQTLLTGRTGSSYGTYPTKSLALLERVVATGRAFWQSHQGTPLRMGEPRVGQIEWVMADTRGMRPIVKVEGAVAVNAEPPIYVDGERALVGEISLPLPPQLSHRLLNAPAIAPALVEQVGRTLSRHLPASSEFVPKAPEPPIVIVDPPVPHLRLFLGKNLLSGPYHTPIAGQLPLARLVFRYGPVEVSITEANPVVEALKANRRYQARRQVKREREAIETLMEVGLELAQEVYELSGPKNQHDLAFYDPIDWLDFLSQDAPELVAQGFEISVDDDFPYRLTKPTGDVDAEVFEGTGLDWFELGMGVQVDGKTLDLAPLLANLVLTDGLDPASMAALAEDDQDIYIPLDDGRHLALAAKRFLPVIIALHELTVGGTQMGKNGRLRFSKAETALLTVLEEQEGIAFKGSDNLRSLARKLNASGADIPAIELPTSFQATLRPYQMQGVGWLNLLREANLGGILADDMGLGKTVQILALLSLEKEQGRLTKPALIIAPTSLMTNWQNEAAKFAPNLSVLLLHGATRKGRFEHIKGHDIVLTTYPLIARDQAVLMEQHWHMAILDEAQTIKNPNSATTKLIRDLKSDHRFCLTGTPMENHLGELWSLMSFVNPGYLGDKTGFTRRWRTPIEKHADAERSAILSRRVKPFLLRRTKQEVASELPPKTEITENIVLDELQRNIYDSIRLSMHKKVRDAIAKKGLAKSHIIILEALLKLRQVCCDPRLLKLSGTSEESKVPSAKLDRLMEMLDSLLADGRKIIVFSQFTSMLHLITLRLEAAGVTFSLLTGDTVDRKSAIESFQNGEKALFLVSLKAGGVGLNLTAADTVILYDPWWNPAVEEQAIDRAYRIGQDKPVFVYRLMASQTIEEKMDELKAKKRALADSIFDQVANPATAFTEDDLDRLFDL